MSSHAASAAVRVAGSGENANATGVSRHTAINTVHNAYLDWFSPGPSKHPVFGKVTSGMDVIKKVETTQTGPGDRPITPVQMIKVTVHD